MSDDTQHAVARYRKRCAVQAVNDALHDLRVADAQLAAIEGRAPIDIPDLLPVPATPNAGMDLAEGARTIAPSVLRIDGLPPPPSASKTVAEMGDGAAAAPCDIAAVAPVTDDDRCALCGAARDGYLYADAVRGKHRRCRAHGEQWLDLHAGRIIELPADSA